ncbi:MAG TPA: M23 family metallopeptidase [Allosphingosinicella sp.]|uniref:M23 family metallopeptidase n=1 Tax=Allosphingosinicella sp. TaxID=2823234 RepID=UPI002ED99143
MTDFVLSNEVKRGGFPKILKPRDIFFHDGKSLRRVRVSVPVQVSAFVAAAGTFCWSVFAAAQLAAAPAPTPTADVARMQQQVQAMQADVQAIKAQVQQRYEMTSAELRRLGIDPSRVQSVGGPFEAVEPLKTAADPNFKALFSSWKKLDQLEQGTIAIPSLKPVANANFTSGFGVRSDPFQGRAAMHGGIDLAGPIGTPIYATADGVVGRSEWAGGYGNLVELNHGKGIQTRYGHLSRSLVAPGQRVKRGDKIALMGSTGRSTGSHLHYEVRIDGKAVNPIPFMQSSDYLVSVQARAAAATRTALGGPSASK